MIHFCASFQVICVQDVSTVYRVPLLLEDQGVVSYFCERLNLPVETSPRRMLSKWKEMADRYENVSCKQQSAFKQTQTRSSNCQTQLHCVTLVNFVFAVLIVSWSTSP